MRRVAARYGSVVFDCDSTLSAIEGIDELAGDRHSEVAALTHAAMLGEIPLEEVYGRRLMLITPTRRQVNALVDKYIDGLVPDAQAVIAALRAERIVVRIMSGGLRPAVAGVAAHLGVPDSDVAAVDVHFDGSGEFAGFDEASPLARAGGKLTVMSAWRRELPAPIMFVGDGATDLEAAPAADLFVAFAGFVDRPAVTRAADVVVQACSLAPILALALGDAPTVHSASAVLRARGRSLLEISHPSPSRTLGTTHR